MSDPFEQNRIPDILPKSWESDLLFKVGPGVLEQTQQALRENSNFHFLCKKCQGELRPWNDSEIYVISYHLEEHYGIPLETPGRRNPSKRLKKQIVKLYDNKCFNCHETPHLHVDHINPDGDAAFRNLQSLCTLCGNRKGNTPPEEIKVYSTIYFGSSSPDCYEGLFW